MNTPNLLIIHTDQQSWWTLGCYGGTVVETPNIDRLAGEGARLDSFFTNSAVCTPSRGCLVTGRYPHCHGAYTNNIPLNRDEVTFAQTLLEHGYETGYAGKWHLDGTPRPGWVHPERSMGFRDCRNMFNRGHWKKVVDSAMGDMSPIVFPYHEIGDEKTFTTDWLTERTIDFVCDSREVPFCFMVSIPDPHSPYTVRAPYDAMYRPQDMPVPSTFSQEHLPSWAAETRSQTTYPLDRPDREHVLRERMAGYFGEVKLIDDCVGRMLTALEEKRILDDTIVVFTTDHGDYMGEHGLGEKNHLYETTYRIPLLVRHPDQIPPGTVVGGLVSTVDFQQTTLGLMGVEPCGREQGRDASPLLRGEETEWIDEVFLHHSSHRRAGIFTAEYELAYVRDDDAILFDRRNDPEQGHNLFDDPGHGDTVADLTERIIQHHTALDSPAAEWLRGLA